MRQSPGVHVHLRTHLPGEDLACVSDTPHRDHLGGSGSYRDQSRYTPGKGRIHRIHSLLRVGSVCHRSSLPWTLTDSATGAFDIVCEMLPHIAMILYRVYPDSHQFLSRLFMFACFTTFGGTIFETIVTMYLFGSLWDQWQIAFKVATPILHLAFCAAQLHGSRIFFIQWRKQARFVREGKGLEAGGKQEETTSPASPQTTLEGSPQSSKVASKESTEEVSHTMTQAV